MFVIFLVTFCFAGNIYSRLTMILVCGVPESLAFVHHSQLGIVRIFGFRLSLGRFVLAFNCDVDLVMS